MDKEQLINRLHNDLAKLQLIDCHTHLDAGHLSARGLHDVLLYHMVISDLYSAGCPDAGRLSSEPKESEIVERIEHALSYLDKIGNTSMRWGLRVILEELFDWHEPITMKNWRTLDERIRKCSGKPLWAREVLQRCGVIHASTEWSLRRDGKFDDILDYSLEWALFTRTQWGQNDAPLYELEVAWEQKQATAPLPVTLRERQSVKRQIHTVADIHAAMRHYCSLIPYGSVYSTAQHLSTDINYRLVSDDEMATALRNREQATTADRDIYASYLLEMLLSELEKHGDEITFMFSLGAEPLPFETGSRLRQDTLGQLAEIIVRHPELRFQCCNSSRHGNQSLCTLVRELPNFSLAGYWWHNFFPDAIKQVCSERLDMLPLNKQIGFFSDAYCVEWTYAKAYIVRNIWAETLAEKIARGQYHYDEAISYAHYIFKNSAEELLRMNQKTLNKP